MKRILQLESLTDGYVYPITDSVNDKGEPTQQRLAAEKMLKKRLPVLDGAPGETLPAFRLAKTPDVFSPHDPFDALLRDDDGRWLFPSKKWKAEQEKRIGKRSDSAARANEHARALAANQVVEGLARLAMDNGPARRPRENQYIDRDYAPRADRGATPAKDAPAKDAPAKDAPAKDAPAKDGGKS